ncbi:Galectin [Macleaya cordata]|uniref:Hexosyltransferase n=1 Tax=Macleaya cordata TaxID=56857 RepID=A0A200QEX4_MACCD|nr:Galectin [Macleaya cordata]
MKKWSGGVLIASLFMLLVLRYGVMKGPMGDSSLSSPFFNSTNPLEWINTGLPPEVQNPVAAHAVSTDGLVSSLFTPRNFSNEEQQSLKTWNYLNQLIGNAGVLPNAIDAIKEAKIAWDSLMASVEEERLSSTNESSRQKMKEKQCPYFLNKMNATEFGDSGYKLRIPCGLIQGSSITIIGIPNGILGNFRIDLTGAPLPGEPDPPIILHFNVRLHGDKSLEPWLVSEVRISGDLKLVSVLASGLPTSEDLEHIIDLEALRAPPLPRKSLDLFVGVFSTANNFKRRMAVRRSWMQYDAVRSGAVAVRFFVGLHKNQIVNEELWNEARTYGDTQLMPFVDYYSLITWKTLAICIFGTEVASAKYVMKTDDDAFVRIDEVLSSLNRINVTHGLLYGLINSDSRPHRNTDSKWYISPEEWPEETYPPWAHGPGYVVSRDIARTVYKKHKKGRLKGRQ